MYGHLGLPEIIFILFFVLMYGIVILVPAWLIVKKAGFNPILSLLILIPLVNLVSLYVFAFTQWPIHRDQRSQ